MDNLHVIEIKVLKSNYDYDDDDCYYYYYYYCSC